MPNRPALKRGVAVLLVAAVLAVAACSQADPGTTTHPETVLLQGRYGSRTITLEIADDPQEQSRGLMDRAALAPDHGMLFVYTDDAERPFWMHNTHFSLDLVFLDASRTVVGIIRRARPESDDVLTIGRPARYVLEVEAGLCDRLGIREGDAITFR